MFEENFITGDLRVDVISCEFLVEGVGYVVSRSLLKRDEIFVLWRRNDSLIYSFRR